MTDDKREELQDRMMELALSEKLGAASPPDLATKLAPTPASSVHRRSAASWRTLVVAVSVFLAAGLGIGWYCGRTDFNDATFFAAADSMPAYAVKVDAHTETTANLESPDLHVDGVDSSESIELTKGLTSADATIADTEPSNVSSIAVPQADLEEPPAASSSSPSMAISKEYDAAPTLGGYRAGSGAGQGVAAQSPRKRKPARGGRGARPKVDIDGDGINDIPPGKDGGGNKGVISDIVEGYLTTRKAPADKTKDRISISGGPAGGVDLLGDREAAAQDQSLHGDRYAQLTDNRFLKATQNPLSTFSIDVDTAAYSKIRSILNQGQPLPPAAVRIEELVNYFSYDYAQPTDGTPFAVHVDVAACPWRTKHRLVRIGLAGKEIAKDQRPPSNLVFLLDVSGSMQPENKLPLVQWSMLQLVDELDERDRVAIVVYAGNSGCVLASTPCTKSNKSQIRDAIARLTAGGSTNGESGIQLAYQIAQDHFIKAGTNRVILCTDGDFNVGVTDEEALKNLLVERAKTGVFLTALGFGYGNLNDRMLEKIADHGNGVYGYVDNQQEAEKLFVRQLSGTLVTIAKDVKIQVEFNPAHVAAYRLIGYENRMLRKEDFDDDRKDAGDIGAGHTVTALYEIVPAGEAVEGADVAAAPGEEQLEFQRPRRELEVTEEAKKSGNSLLVKLRYKDPDGDTSKLLRYPVKDAGANFAAASADFKFAASVAAFGMILRNSPYRGDLSLDAVMEIAASSRGEDKDKLREEFVRLLGKAKEQGRR